MQNIYEIMKTQITEPLELLPKPEVSLLHQLTDEQKQMLVNLGMLSADELKTELTAQPEETVQPEETAQPLNNG